MSNGERMIDTNGVELCVETFGNASDPAILLIHGACASMLWWEEELCERIARQRRFVIRFDNRDTGRSTTFPVGYPGYSLTDMAKDAVGILDALDVSRAHIVGRSMAGGIALVLGVDYPERIAALTFVATTTGNVDLPPMSDAFVAAVQDGPDMSGGEATIESIVKVIAAYHGESPFFDEDATRALATRDVARSRNIAAAMTNHFQIDVNGPAGGGFGDITAPTLVIHGDLDPVFPLAHGEDLQRSIPNAELLVLRGAGHAVPRQVWDVFVPALVRQQTT
jgi:pimeloyl-ACP methyl ester carboxylesterase